MTSSSVADTSAATGGATTGGPLVPTDGYNATQLAYGLGADLTPVSLTIANTDITYDAWENIGRCIGFVGNAWQWWVGDWLNAGEALYGEESAQAVDTRESRYDIARRVTPVEQGRLANIRSVCTRVPASRRRVELTFSHHEEVAALDPQEQTDWLQIAIDHGFTKSELRQAIRESKQQAAGQNVDDGGEGGQAATGGKGPSISERIEEAARLVYNQAQSTSDGSFLVPSSAMAQLASALGEES